ncbi:DUF1573 domain-containing protein [uncultured Alistipes sp.]|uniref:DUF1573 domain-containing protein n=1 Tax=uncultured Alistipes sp. TaxID=538949 RepID=UPI0032B2A21F
MRRRGPLAICCAALLFAGSCGRQQTAVPEQPVAVRTVTVTDSLLLRGGSDTIRLGRLHEGERARVGLQLRNGTDRPMVMLQHELTCGCIALEYDRRPVKPSEALSMQIDFDTRGLYGWQLKLFRLLPAGAREPLRIYVEAEVE